MGHKTTFITGIGLSALLLLAACATPSDPDATVSDQGQTVVQDSQGPSGPVPGSQEDFDRNAENQVLFAFDRFDLSDSAKRVLRQQAAWLRAHPESKILIEGNCDERGTREYNLALGARRANSAKDYLVEQGIDASRVRTISYGKERPVCTASSESCWQRNRNATTVVREGGA